MCSKINTKVSLIFCFIKVVDSPLGTWTMESIGLAMNS